MYTKNNDMCMYVCIYIRRFSGVMGYHQIIPNLTI